MASTKDIAALAARVDSLTALIEKMALASTATTATVTPPTTTTETTNDAPKTAQRAARRQNRQANVKTEPTNVIKYPKADAGTVTGTVVRHAGGARHGYGMLVKTATGERWVNTPRANGGQPLLAVYSEGQSVTFNVNEGGFLVKTDAPVKTATTKTAPMTTTKTNMVTSAPAPTTLRVTASPTAYAVVTKSGEMCPKCAGSHYNESFRKRELECFERVYTLVTGKTPGGVKDADFTRWVQADGFEKAAPAAVPQTKTPRLTAAQKAARRAKLSHVQN